ncbi:MAG TPA: hypothetical protein VJA40_01345 [archaeon]|nr:hypothetical protein [archaeon]
MSHFKQAAYAYAENINVVALYAILLVVGGLSVFVPGTSTVSGGAFLATGELSKLDPVQAALLLVYSLAVLFVYSFLTAVLVMAVSARESNTEIASMVVHELIGAHTSRIFIFNALVVGAAFLAAIAVPQFSVPLVFLAMLPLMFVPAAIVVDELSLQRAVEKSADYLVRFPENVIYYLIVGFALTALTGFVNFAFDQAVFIGKYVSLVFAAFFAAPFLTILQVELYLHKFGLMRKRPGAA